MSDTLKLAQTLQRGDRLSLAELCQIDAAYIDLHKRLRLATEALKVYANTGDINSGTPNIARWALAQLSQPAPAQPAQEKEWRGWIA